LRDQTIHPERKWYEFATKYLIIIIISLANLVLSCLTTYKQFVLTSDLIIFATNPDMSTNAPYIDLVASNDGNKPRTVISTVLYPKKPGQSECSEKPDANWKSFEFEGKPISVDAYPIKAGDSVVRRILSESEAHSTAMGILSHTGSIQTPSNTLLVSWSTESGIFQGEYSRLAGPAFIPVTQAVLDALANVSTGTNIMLHSYGGSNSGASELWSCVATSGSTHTSNQTSNNRSNTLSDNIRPVSFSEMLHNATINVSAGTMLDFTSGNSNVGSSLVSSNNPSVASIMDSVRVQTNAQGKAVISVDLYTSTGRGQTGSRSAHYVTVNVQ
jgi:hypothetical protein